jgi:membrane fusion protein
MSTGSSASGTAPSRTSSPANKAALFRAEAVAHAGTRSRGTVLLARPLSYSLLTSLFLVLTSSVILFFACFSYTRKAAVPGTLLPASGVIRVVAAQAGVISERRVAEGQHVKAGDVLFLVASDRTSVTQGDAAQTVSALLESRRASFERDQAQLRLQGDQRVAAARQRADDMALEIRRVDEQAALQQRRVALAETALKRYADLQAADFVSPVQVQDKQAELLDQQLRLADLRRTSAASARELAAARADLQDLQIQALRDRQASDRSIAATDQDLTENEARRLIVVRAPRDGTVTAITVEPGQSVSANQSLASILPQGSVLEAELYAPSRAAGFLKVGMPVMLRHQAYSYQKFGMSDGVIREVSRNAMRPEELDLPGGNAGAGPVYRVRVTLARQTVTVYGVDEPLKSGAVVDASVLLERRRLFEWVLEPLYTITGHP